AAMQDSGWRRRNGFTLRHITPFFFSFFRSGGAVHQVGRPHSVLASSRKELTSSNSAAENNCAAYSVRASKVFAMLKLGVNIDHVATLREARYRGRSHGEPDLIEAASACESAGAHGITVHLREDRRHIQDRDVWRLREVITTRLHLGMSHASGVVTTRFKLEMTNTSEIVTIALGVRPDIVCFVPERRQEITTEGGLDVAAHANALS